jgi:hypothetical protein
MLSSWWPASPNLARGSTLRFASNLYLTYQAQQYLTKDGQLIKGPPEDVGKVEQWALFEDSAGAQEAGSRARQRVHPKKERCLNRCTNQDPGKPNSTHLLLFQESLSRDANNVQIFRPNIFNERCK